MGQSHPSRRRPPRFEITLQDLARSRHPCQTGTVPSAPRRRLIACALPGAEIRSVIPLKDENPAERFPLVTIALVAANLAAFAWQVLGVGLEQSVLRGGAIPYEILTLSDIE